MASNTTYAAFISYRHLPRDTEVAKQVQTAIETYRIPRGAQVREGFTAGQPLGRCFRDEDELAAAHSLPESIVEALRSSSALVVVCSPHTKESTWVTREIEAFVGMHGQERVFAVLAQGSSAESIPETLRTKTVIDVDGEERRIPAQPLAADFRPESSQKHAEERLRIVAAVAGCGFDDLRQRDKARKRKRIMLGVVVACVLAALIGALAWSAHTNRQNALVQESRTLAAQSQKLYAQGDRYEAIQTALAALPKNAADSSRPVVPEALDALEQALNLDRDSSRVWFPCYSLEVKDQVVQVAASPNDGWFAILDSSCGITVYQTLTGRKISECVLPQAASGNAHEADSLPESWTIAAARNRLIAAERDGSGIVACFNVATGKLEWSIESAIADAIAVSGDGVTLDIFHNAGDSLLAAAIDVASGQGLGVAEAENPGYADFSVFLPACIGTDASTMHVGIGQHCYRFNIEDDKSSKVALDSGQVIWSTLYQDGVLALASSNRMDKNYSATAQWRAFDQNLEEVWSHEANWSYGIVGEAYESVAIDAWPKVWDVANFGQSAFVCTAGSVLQAFATEDGRELLNANFTSPVVGVGIGYESDNSDFVLAVCADGKVQYLTSSASGFPLAHGSGLDFTLPCSVDCANVAWTDDTAYTVVARDATNTQRMVVYALDAQAAQENAQSQNYSLEELTAMATDVLEEAGR